MIAMPQGVQKGGAEAPIIESYINFDANLRQGQLGGWVGWAYAAGGGVGTCVCSRFVCSRATALVMCHAHVPEYLFLLIFRVLAYF